MAALLLYIALLLVLYMPPEIKSPGENCVNEARGACAFALALFSACALPWGGVSLLSCFAIGSGAWLPSIAAAILISPEEKSSGYTGKATLIASLAAFFAVMSRFMDKTGVPGELYSIEGFSMILRLWGFPAAIAMCLASAGLALSFMEARGNGCESSLADFSFFGFWAIAFVPLDFSVFGLAHPRLSAILTPAALFIISCIFRRLLLRHCDRADNFSGGLWKRLPAALTASGCLLLAIQ
jgi:hypothetical protein